MDDFIKGAMLLPMLFQLIGRSLRFSLYKDSLFEVVCDKDEGRYNYTFWKRIKLIRVS